MSSNLSSADMPDAPRLSFADFTEDHYRQLLAAASSRFRFVTYGTTCAEPHALWRHDVDFSPHRALRLAQLERDAGVRATYLFLLHSEFYNLLEPSVTKKVREILALGHPLGLHFDLAFYGAGLSRDELEGRLVFEKRILEQTFDHEVNAFSFHNPDNANALAYAEDRLGGMINLYGATLKREYRYCSDSNGYWRFARLMDVITDPASQKLHVLTHPEWWVPEPMSPRDRVSRCIDGRAQHVHRFYDDLMVSYGRLNVR